MKSRINNRKDKKAVSLMLSYVILIVIVITLAIAVYAYISTFSADVPADCDEGTSIMITDYECDPSGNLFRISVENNGYFDVNGFEMAVGNNTENEPLTQLKTSSAAASGTYQFLPSLGPGEIRTVDFSPICIPNRPGCDSSGKVNIGEIKVLRFQPFVIKTINHKAHRIVCQAQTPKIEIEDCPFG